MLIEKMKKRAATCERMYVQPLYVKDVFDQGNQIPLRMTEKIVKSAHLPTFPSLTDRDAVEISGKLNKMVRDGL